MMRRSLVFAGLGICLFSFSIRAETINVNRTADKPALDPTLSALDCDGMITIRSAIQRSNFTPEADTINIPAGAYPITLSPFCIDPATTGREATAAVGSGLPTINSDVTIVGAGANVTTILPDPGLGAPIFRIIGDADRVASISGIRFSGGTFGAIYIDGVDASISDCVFEDNGNGSGGAIVTLGADPTVTNCVFESNTSTGMGGAVFANGGAPHFHQCTFNRNSAGLSGGAISCTNGRVVVVDCDFNTNSASSTGGAIDCSVNTTGDVQSSRFRTNSGTGGGAISASSGSILDLTQCLFDGNLAGSGGGPVTVAAAPDGGSGAETKTAAQPTPGGGGAIRLQDATATADACTLSQNSETSGIGGGAIYGTGFSLTGCTLTGNSTTFSNGGAIFNVGQFADASATDCTFTGNISNYGGAIFFYGAKLSLTRCAFNSNHGTFGGGALALLNIGGSILDCTFLMNDADGGSGGAIDCTSNATPDVKRCSFTRNSALYGGGAIAAQTAGPSIVDCRFEENETTHPMSAGGGGILIQGNSPRRVEVRRGRFTGNHSPAGGSLYLRLTQDCLIEDCLFLDGMATVGGALYLNSPASLNRCRFLGNQASLIGGAAIILSDRPLFANCLFTGNTAGETGGAIATALTGVFDLINCTLVGNSAGIGLGALDIEGGTDSRIRNSILRGNTDNSTPDMKTTAVAGPPYTLQYSNMENPPPGEGNIDLDPLFADADGADNQFGTEDDDLRLLPGSPSIDAGYNNHFEILALAPIDLAGGPRFYDDPAAVDCSAAAIQCGVPPVIDMGALEAYPDCDANHVADDAELGRLDQWAFAVLDFSSQYGDMVWSAAQTLGPADTFKYCDCHSNWAPETPDRTPEDPFEFLSLAFDQPVFADGVTVVEAFGNGFVARIDLIDVDDITHTVFDGDDSTADGIWSFSRFNFPRTGYLVKAVTVYIDSLNSPAWEEIDAVQLHGFAPDVLFAADCNTNGRPDACDAADAGDCDTNGRLDFCEFGATPGELIVNGDFETGNLTGWTLAGSYDGTFEIDPSECGGAFEAISKQGDPATHSLNQQFVIPSGAATATLHWVDRIPASATIVPGSQEYRVLLRDGGGGLLATLSNPQTGISPDQPCTPHTADLTAYRGQLLTLSFEVQVCCSEVRVSIDDVSLIVGTVTECNGNAVPDACELAGNDCNSNQQPDDCETDTDGDGSIDVCDGCPTDPARTSPGVCGCGIPETDFNTNGQIDCTEVDLCPNDPDKTNPGACGCGIPDTDANQDGLADCLGVDNCPGDPDKTLPGLCGCGVPDTDSDGDQIPDCLDPDPGTPNEPPPQGTPPMCGACGAGAAPGVVASLLLLAGLRGRPRHLRVPRLTRRRGA